MLALFHRAKTATVAHKNEIRPPAADPPARAVGDARPPRRPGAGDAPRAPAVDRPRPPVLRQPDGGRGIARDVAGAVEVAKDGKARTIDVGRARFVAWDGRVG